MKRFLGLCVWALIFSAIPALGASLDSGQPALRSVAVIRVEEDRSRILDVVGWVAIPDEMKPTPGAEQLNDLRDEAVRKAKENALRQVSDWLAERGRNTTSWALRKPPGIGDVHIISMAELPPERDRLSVLIKADVGYQLETAKASKSSGSSEDVSAPSPAEAGISACGDRVRISGDSAEPGTASAENDVAKSKQLAAQCTSLPCLSQDGEAPLKVDLWTDQSTYKAGEEVVVHLHANQDFFGRILYKPVKGDIIQVLPNEFRTDDSFKSGTHYLIPGEGDKFKLIVTAPFGEESIVVYASDKPIGAVPATAIGNGLKKMDVSENEVDHRTRSLMIVGAEAMASKAAQNAAQNKEPTQHGTGDASGSSGASADMYHRECKLTTEPATGNP